MNTTLQWAMLFSALTDAVDRPEETHPTDHRVMVIDLTDRVVESLNSANVGLCFVLPSRAELTHDHP